jgi:multidrug efflux pump subunit AcrA (membrane-fusion protein)
VGKIELAMNILRRVLAVLIPFGILVAAIMAAKVLVLTKPQVEKQKQQQTRVPVTIQQVHFQTSPVSVDAQGTVTAARELVVQSELTGRVVWLHPNLKAGGLIKKGELLLRIDSRDYGSMVEQQKAAVAMRSLELANEKSQQMIATREWERMGPEEQKKISEEGRDILLRKPHLAATKAALRAAKSSLSQSQRNVHRTAIRAPFDAFVRDESVEMGQLVSPASRLAVLVGTENFEIQVAVTPEQLMWIQVPQQRNQPGSKVTVWQNFGEDRVEHEGDVIGLLGDVDPSGKMARVLVSIQDPFGLHRSTNSTDKPKAANKGTEGKVVNVNHWGANKRLLVGSFVHVKVKAGTLENVAEIARAAVHDGDQVYLVDSQDRLDIRHIEIAYRKQNSVLIRGGLKEGDRLIISQIPTPAKGTLLRITSTPGAAASVQGG